MLKKIVYLAGFGAEKYIHEIFVACYCTVQYIPMNPVAGIIGGTPFTIMGTRAPIAIGTGGTIPIVGMPNKECRKKGKVRELGLSDNSDTNIHGGIRVFILTLWLIITIKCRLLCVICWSI